MDRTIRVGLAYVFCSVLFVFVLCLVLAGLYFLFLDPESEKGDQAQEALKGRDSVITTYDDAGNLLDRLTLKSVQFDLHSRSNFKGSAGFSLQSFTGISFTVDGKSLALSGGNLILRDNELENLLDEYSKTLDIVSLNKDDPFIDQLVKGLESSLEGKKKLVLIRSRSGQPLAAFAGNEISTSTLNKDGVVSYQVDDLYALTSQCNFTVYDLDLLTAR